MEVEIIEKTEQFRQLEPYWNPHLEKSGSNTIFLTYEWFDAYLRTIAEFKKLSTVVVKDQNKILGIAPLMLQKREGFNLLCIIGHEVLDYEDFIIHPVSRSETIRAIFAALMKIPGWSLFKINKVPEDSPNLCYFQKFAERNHTRSRLFSVAPYLTITGNYETYWNSLKKSFRNDVRRRSKKMEQSWGEPQFVHASEPDEQIRLFDTLVDFHIQRRSDRKGDYSFLARPERRAFYKAVIEKTAKKGTLNLSQLRLDKRTVAVHLGFKYSNCFYYYLPTFDVEFEKYAVGYSLLRMLLQECFDNGCHIFDFLLGDETYKSRFKPVKRQLYSFTFFPNNFMGKVARLWWDGVREQLRNNPAFMRLLPKLYKANILKTNT